MIATKGSVGTEIGPLEVILIRGDLAMVSTPSGAPVTIREQDFSVNCRFTLADGVWTMLDERGISRVKYWGMAKYNKTVPPTFAAKGEAAALEALTKFVAEDTGALNAAEVEYRQRLADDALRAYEELAKQLADAQLKLGEAQTKLAMARAAQENAQENGLVAAG